MAFVCILIAMSWCVPQDQYVFIHDAVLEAITCGNTQIPAPSLQSTLETLAKWDYKKEQDGFDAQFHVSHVQTNIQTYRHTYMSHTGARPGDSEPR